MDTQDLIRQLSEKKDTLLKASEVYQASIKYLPQGPVFMLDAGECDYLVTPDNIGFQGICFETGDKHWVLCPLSPENAQNLRQLFPFTAPRPILDSPISFGMGDRLGIATPGQLRAITRFNALPVLAQQSVRELRLTGRTFQQVLDDVTFMVFREGYTRGFGADADHLKSVQEVELGLFSGYTMLTLDCSDYIRYDALAMTDDDVERFAKPQPLLEELYAGKSFSIGDAVVTISRPELLRMSILYGDALDFVCSIFWRYLADRPDIDLEMSVDETDCPTTPEQHLFIAAELKRRGVKLNSLAPRFCGQFQKGVDYIGDLKELESDFLIHAAIAKNFGYKLSLHSGSDKFSVFPLFARCTKGCFHVKTAGTSWLEAMAVVAEFDPSLYRRAHEIALKSFSEAKKYYHVTTDLSKIPALATLRDEDLIGLFSQNDARQLIHLTYGFILQSRDEQGHYLCREQLFSCWRNYAEEYAKRLDTHMTRHLQALCGGAIEE